MAPAQPDKVAVVTGANSGLGFETSLALAKNGMTVVLACRNLKKAEAAKQQLLHAYAAADLKIIQLDLADISSVKHFAELYKTSFDRLDLLVNNAGIMMSPYKKTIDGFENQLATNYLGHFALTGLLLPLLLRTSGARIVSLSSLSYKWAGIRFHDLHFEEGYSKRKAYGQSKRACLVFAYALQRRLSAAGADTLSVAAHPGLSKTELDRHFPKLIRPLGSLFLQPANKGALPILFAALGTSINGGEYIGPDGFQELRGYPTKVDSDDDSKNLNTAKRLWEVSEKMTGVCFLN